MGDSPNPPPKEQSSRKLLKPEEVPSVVTGDALILLRKKYFFPDDLVVRVPAASERACRPPAGYVAAYEMNFQAGVQFLLPSELIEILKEADKARNEVVEALSEVAHLQKFQKILESKVRVLELENTRLSGSLIEKEIKADVRAVEDFKNSLDFRMIIQEQVQQERDKILDVEVKELERQCHEEGFLQDFLKTSTLVHRRTGADIEGLSPSQVFEDPSSDVEEAESVTESEDVDID